VLAHEMAHAEQGHVTQRIGFAPSAVLLQLGRLIKSDARSLSNGGADAFMRQVAAEGHLKMIEDMLEAGTLGQELQADCYAVQWLSHMQAAGLENRPEDVADAQLSLLGLSAAMVKDDPFMGPRVRAILSGAYSTGGCD